MIKIYLLTLLFLLYWCHGVCQSIDGQVTTKSGAPIPETIIELSTTLGNEGPIIEKETDSEGLYSIQITASSIDEANNQGATWIITAKKQGYKKTSRNVYVTKSLVEPSVINFQLESDPYSPNYPIVDNCIKKSNEVVSIYLFDLKSGSEESDVAMLLTTLRYKMDSEIINYLESYDLRGGLDLEIIRCPGLEVSDNNYAVHYGSRLNAEGIIWGSSQKLDSIYTIVSLTYIKSPILTGLTTQSYSNNISDIINIPNPIPEEYIAFSLYIIGNVHMSKGNKTYAKRCFQRALLINALPNEYAQSLLNLTNELESEDLSTTLTPINN